MIFREPAIIIMSIVPIVQFVRGRILCNNLARPESRFIVKRARGRIDPGSTITRYIISQLTLNFQQTFGLGK